MNTPACLRPTVAGDALRVPGDRPQTVRPPCPEPDHGRLQGRGFGFACLSCGAFLANRYQLDAHCEPRPADRHPRFHFVARVCPFHGAEAWAPESCA